MGVGVRGRGKCASNGLKIRYIHNGLFKEILCKILAWIFCKKLQMIIA